MLASGSLGYDGEVKLWDLAKMSEVATLLGHTNSVWGVAFARDGKTLASVAWDGTIRLWDTRTKVGIATLGRKQAPHHEDLFDSVAYSPDGKSIATGDGNVRLWDVTSRAVAFAPLGHVADVRAVAFTPDGRHLVSGGCVGEIIVWDLAKRKEVLTLWGEPRSELWSMALSPDGGLVASGSSDGSIKIWDISKALHPPKGR
jgi:WD40 repeat protein